MAHNDSLLISPSRSAGDRLKYWLKSPTSVQAPSLQRAMVMLSQFSQVSAYSFVIYEAQSPSQMKNPSGSPIAVTKSSSVPLQLLAGSGAVVEVDVELVAGAFVVVLSTTVVSPTAADVDAASSEPSDEQLASVNTDARHRTTMEVERHFRCITVRAPLRPTGGSDDENDGSDIRSW